jgi:peptidoglycan/xylan/chitin deacetylase (PgdA/CDA1 family)
MAWAVRGRASSVFGPSVYRAPAGRRAIALTFDDGPSESTPQVLELLARHAVPATFFQIGANVERLPEIARAVLAAGHEIGNHSHTHPLFCSHSAEFIYQELARAQRAIRDITGATPSLLRAPFGARWFGFRGAQRRLGLRGVMWTAIGYDWKLKADTIGRGPADPAIAGSGLQI